jgi:nucleoid-associated protein YgaU
LLWASTGYAQGGENFFDRMFTFREDQKAVIAPKYASVPKVVKQPYYPTQEHEAWSNFYTRSDLVPQDYLGSSASKVMRPSQAMPFGAGWQAIEAQARENARAAARDQTPQPGTLTNEDALAAAKAPAPDGLQIGEPGEGVAMKSFNGDLGRAMEIGAPKRDWRDNPNDIPLTPRPGDFDYKASVTGGDYGNVQIGNVGNRRSAPASSSASSRASDSQLDDTFVKDLIAEMNQSAQPETIKAYKGPHTGDTTYTVRTGDTLQTIAAQSAVYGNAKMWPLIYSANRSQIGKKPTHLKSGLKLTIPRNYTEKQAREAVKKSGIK